VADLASNTAAGLDAFSVASVDRIAFVAYATSGPSRGRRRGNQG